jgi:hypothetical protein
MILERIKEKYKVNKFLINNFYILIITILEMIMNKNNHSL